VPKFRLDDFNDEVVDSLKIFLSNRTRVGYQFDYVQNTHINDGFSIASTLAPPIKRRRHSQYCLSFV